jgi:hypothetical protein
MRGERQAGFNTIVGAHVPEQERPNHLSVPSKSAAKQSMTKK